MLVFWLMLAACVLFCISYRRRSRYLEPSKYPGSLPLIGHLYVVTFVNTSNLFSILENVSRHCLESDDATLIDLFIRSDYVVADPDDALTVANSCLNKNFMYRFARPWLGNGLITASVSTWKRHRKLLNPTFGLQVMHSYLDTFNKQSRRLMEELDKHAGQGPFDHLPDIRQNTLETICMTAMGMTWTDKRIDEKYLTAVNEILLMCLRRYLIPWLYFDFSFRLSPQKLKQDKNIEILHHMSNEVIPRWRSENKQKIDEQNQEVFSGKKCKPFLELLLTLSEEFGLFTDDEVRNHVDTIIVSGYETVASVMFFTVVLIGSHQQVQDRLLEELQEIFGDDDRDVTNQDLPRLVFLEAVLKESMRLYSVVPIIGRYIDRDLKLKKCTLFKGNTCYLSLYGIHRHPQWGKDANQFVPERWLDSATLPVSANAFLPFSLGKRSCIGKTYAMMLLKTMMVHFVLRYKVTADHSKMVLRMEFLLKSVAGHEISIERR